MTTGLFDGYEPGSFFDEAVEADGTPRAHYTALLRRLGGFTSHQLAERERVRDAAFRQAGITFTVYGEGEGVERTFPMDLVPRIIPADEWAHLEEGLVQRVTALNRFLDDLYVGDQAVVKDGIIPRWLITSSDGFQREAYGIAGAARRPLPGRRHRPRARRRGHLPGAGGQPAQPERRVLRAREPGRHDPGAAARVRRPPRPPGRPLRPVAARARCAG